MAEVKKISYDVLKDIAAEHNFGIDLMLKDYYVTLVLYLLKDVQGVYFKGGTALQKIFLNYARLSEDADFTVTGDISKIKKVIAQTLEESKVFNKITYDKDVEGFTRIVAHYTNFSGRDDVVFVDINQRARLIQKPEQHEIVHFYKEFIPNFSVNTLSREEMFAEKVAATVGRNRPRDHYDVYTILKAGLQINIELVKQKCKQSGTEFNIQRMFSKADKLKVRWDRDMIPLLAKEVPFVEVMRTLARHFKLKEVKEAEKQTREPHKLIKAFVFDMGGVLLLNEIKQVYLKLANLLEIDGSSLVDLIRQNKLKFMNGEYSGEEFAALIKKHFKLPDSIVDIVGKWKDAFSELMVVNDELYDIIRRLKKNYVIALVTNAPELHAKINREKNLYAPFKPLIISCEVGLVKPQPEIFELALNELKLKPEECVFIDDAERNIAVARDLGFKTLHFVDNNQFVKELKLLGAKL